MIIDKPLDDVLPVTKADAASIKPVDRVNAVTELPESGQELPLRDNKQDKGKEVYDTAVKEINQYVQSHRSELNFTIDESSGKTVIKVIDTQTGELIRQIPGEEVLKVAQKLREGADFEIFKIYT